jgi:hypothetical protein
MATAKQLELRMKYAKTSVNTLTKKLAAAKARVAKLEGDLKKAKAAAPKGAKKPAAKKPAAKKKAGAKKKK